MASESSKTEGRFSAFLRRRYNSVKKALKKYWMLKVARIILAIWAMYPLVFGRVPGTLTIADPDPRNTRDGYIIINGSERPIITNNPFEWVLLALARTTAFAMYPDMLVIFFSKCRATQAFLSSSPFSMFLFRDMHDVHAYSGRFIALMAAEHTILHVIRWAYAGNLSLLYRSTAGITGSIVEIATPFITYLMTSDKMRMIFNFEIRKGLHYLFYVFAIALCYHVPTTALPFGGYIRYVLATCIIWYTLDKLYIYLFLTERCATPTYQVSPNGIQMKAKLSPHFHARLKNGGYTYVCLPWIDKKQWHAFSLYEYPGEEDTACVFMDAAGDWTRAVHKALQRRHTARPVWFSGPFPSPYNNADMYDNQILIASGIGITPALSALHSLRSTRRVNIIWMVRDPHMLDFFTRLMKMDDDGWFLIFYTGKVPISDKYEKLKTNVKIIKKRPNLEMIITNIVYGIESGKGLPEKAVKNSEKDMLEALQDKIQDLDDTGMTTAMKLTELMKYADHYGFELTPYMDELQRSQRQSRLETDMHEKVVQDLEKTVIEEDSGSHVFNIYDDNFCEIDDEPQELEVTKTLSSLGIDQGEKEKATVDEEMGINKPLLEMYKELVKEPQLGRRNSNNRMSVHEMMHAEDEESPPKVNKNPRAKNATRRASYTLMRHSSAVLVDPIQDYGDAGKNYVEKLLATSEGRAYIKAWGLLYCGGNEHIRKNLKAISRDYRLDLNTECFKW